MKSVILYDLRHFKSMLCRAGSERFCLCPSGQQWNTYYEILFAWRKYMLWMMMVVVYSTSAMYAKLALFCFLPKSRATLLLPPLLSAISFFFPLSSCYGQKFIQKLNKLSRKFTVDDLWLSFSCLPKNVF